MATTTLHGWHSVMAGSISEISQNSYSVGHTNVGYC